MKRLVASLVLLSSACGTVVEIEPVPDDYESWYRVDTIGAIPGHGDSYRIIYANDVARSRGAPDQDGVITDYLYPTGSIIVKEIRERDGDMPGPIRYFGVMRKLEEAPAGAELHSASPTRTNGWLFTYLASIDSEEQYRPRCWNTCHSAAPIDGAYLDYGAL